MARRQATTIGELTVFAEDLKENFNIQFSNLTTNFNTFKDDVNKNFNEVKENQKKTNGRIGKLELWRALIIGFVLAINVLVYPALGYFLVRYFDIHFIVH